MRSVGGAIGRWSKRWCSAGLRCCEVIGLRLEDLQPTKRRVFIAEGKGGHQRSDARCRRSSSQSVSNYLSAERPADAPSDSLFVSLKGARRW